MAKHFPAAEFLQWDDAAAELACQLALQRLC
jgi:hypothetical protein